MNKNRRPSATVDSELLQAERATVQADDAASLSELVNHPLRREAANERRLDALDAFLDSFAAEHSAISDEDMARAEHSAREHAVVTRGAARVRATQKPSR